ncbi:hypothetical protein EJ03DRAFT_132670 [Teratosphaeria nubilosa]|uniref:AB hydrolase-1 domain-containing protein n=1 Tax=Teratosphaeria nubilosa TaxID=161662 RepID=A0A6G1LMT1_9PEZI|nr:hypothetical protein EJ03DRAFT_132670 [Teratosphaeria nubilosa]
MYDQIGCGGRTHFPDQKGDVEFWTVELFMAKLENGEILFRHRSRRLISWAQSWGGMLAGQCAIERQPPGLRKLIISDSPADMQREGVIWMLGCGFMGSHLCRLDPWPGEYLKAVRHLMAGGAVVYGTMNGPSEFFVLWGA